MARAKKPKQTVMGSSIKDIKAAAQADFGKELIKTLDEKPPTAISGISCGSPGINAICTGNPFVGIVPGRVYEVFGAESSGKTTLCLHIVAEAQVKGATVSYIDMEHALDPVYANKIGVDTKALLLSQPDYGEQGLAVAERLIELGVVIIILDSVAALVPRAEYEGNMGDSHMGLMARMMGQGLRKITSKLSKSQSSMIFINQTRQKIGAMFGNPEVTTGGNALKFWSSVRLRTSLSVAADKAIKGANDTLLGNKDKERIGSVMKIKVVKNKIYKPFGEHEIPVYYGMGMDTAKDWFDYAQKMELITKAGGSYYLPQSKGNKKTKVSMNELSAYVYDVKELIKAKVK